MAQGLSRAISALEETRLETISDYNLPSAAWNRLRELAGAFSVVPVRLPRNRPEKCLLRKANRGSLQRRARRGASR